MNILDIKSRNEAIDLMWVKKYLSLGNDRPIWAYAADYLILKNIPKSGKKYDNRLIEGQNPFTQTWAPAMHTGSKLPKDIKIFLQTAKKYNVNMEAIRVSDKAKKDLPAWFHIGSEEHPIGLFRRATTECLINTHNIKTIDDLHKTTRRKRDIFMRPRHENNNKCECRFCETDRDNGCENPNTCCDEAIKAMQRLQPKWNPISKKPIDNLSLTKGRLKVNNEGGNEGFITFNPSIGKDENIEHIIRVFTNPNTKCADPAYRKNRDNIQIDQKQTVYTDGSCTDSGFEEARTGAGIWFGNNNPNNEAIRVQGTKQSNQVGEIMAIMRSVQKVTDFTPLDIITDSKYAMNGLTIHLNSWEEQGFIKIKNEKLFRAVAAKLRQRGAPTRLKWVKGHSNIQGNENADKLAEEGAKKEHCDEIDIEIENKFNLTGAQLSKLNQATAYQGIKDRKKKPTQRIGTMERLDATRYAVKEINKKTPTDETIWKAIQHEDFQKQIRIFFWKTMHNAQKLGKYQAYM